ncbi:beta-propeller domain-containing protein [Patescibacteria group bacterium]|nr:beta-propeller domain-containing protein [Patescibacteria group bacterium]
MQVEGVEEADIIKSDGDYLYYYNQRLQQIMIIASPRDKEDGAVDLDNAEVIKKLNLPSNFYGSQLYIEDDKLVIIGQRWSNSASNSFIDRGNKIDVIVYDVSNVEKPKLMKFSDLDGYYTDSRMIDGKLYLVSQLNVNRRWAFNGLEKLEDVELLEDDVLPKAIDISYTQDDDKQNLKIGDQTFPYRVGVHRPSCDSIFYVLPDKETVKQFGLQPSFTVVRVIDINDTEEEIQTTTAFGNTQTIHMSMDGLYLTNSFWMPYPFSCPINARCILPWYDQGANTLIHKFAIGDDSLVSYVDSTIIEGEPLSQYSMSEDSDGNFRILTKTWTPQLATHLAILDEDLDAVGLLRNIEP